MVEFSSIDNLYFIFTQNIKKKKIKNLKTKREKILKHTLWVI